MDATTLAAVIAAITALIGTFGGYWFAGRNDEKRDERAAQREKDARREEVVARREDQRHEVQVQTLTALQDELQGLLAAYMRMMINDFNVRSGDEIDRTLRDKVNADHGERLRTAQRLQSRILDSQLRDAVTTFTVECQTVLDGEGRTLEQYRADIERRFGTLHSDYQTLVEHVGAHLRRELDRVNPH